MNEDLPTPDFNSSQYERPNQNWVCGRAREGAPCHLGPDHHGHCHVTSECQPSFKKKEGEAKGRYYCMRPAERGGPCAHGPLPDGRCAIHLQKCVPVRSLRHKRKILTLAMCIFTTGFLLMALCGSMRWNFISPGPLSNAHATSTFAHRVGSQENCAVCHTAADGGIFSWAKTALKAKPAPWQIRSLAQPGNFGMTDIDDKCLVCHSGHSFHEPNVTRVPSCSNCHIEHHGPGPMPKPTDENCLACHANAGTMQASADQGQKLAAAEFDFQQQRGRVIFHALRPKRGFTEIIHSFDSDHPEFRVVSEHLKDPDTLRFNHQLHLNPAIVASHGKKLECVDCHKPDAAGVYHLKITYQENCAMCHSNQFDPRNPGLLIPHGKEANVRAFLRTLPQQYADDYGRMHPGADHDQRENFAREEMRLLRADYGSGEDLERAVFFNGAKRGLSGPALFSGCAFCHEVKLGADTEARVTPPAIPDRWLIHGNFDHSKHLQNIRNGEKLDCAVCHDARQSHQTADIIMPSIATCVVCHSPSGGVSSSCSTCHGYHASKNDALAQWY